MYVNQGESRQWWDLPQTLGTAFGRLADNAFIPIMIIKIIMKPGRSGFTNTAGDNILGAKLATRPGHRLRQEICRVKPFVF